MFFQVPPVCPEGIFASHLIYSNLYLNQINTNIHKYCVTIFLHSQPLLKRILYFWDVPTNYEMNIYNLYDIKYWKSHQLKYILLSWKSFLNFPFLENEYLFLRDIFQETQSEFCNYRMAYILRKIFLKLNLQDGLKCI